MSVGCAPGRCMGCRTRQISTNKTIMASSRKHLESCVATHPGDYHRLQFLRHVPDAVPPPIQGTGWPGIYPGPGEPVCSRPGLRPSGRPWNLLLPSPRSCRKKKLCLNFVSRCPGNITDSPGAKTTVHTDDTEHKHHNPGNPCQVLQHRSARIPKKFGCRLHPWVTSTTCPITLA